MYVCLKILVCIGNLICGYGRMHSYCVYTFCWLPVISHSMFISVSAGFLPVDLLLLVHTVHMCLCLN